MYHHPSRPAIPIPDFRPRRRTPPLRMSATVLGLLFTAFSALGLYHAVLTGKWIARGGPPADIAIALALAVISFFFAWAGLRALRRPS